VPQTGDDNSVTVSISPTTTTADIIHDKPVEQDNHSNITGFLSVTPTFESGNQAVVAGNSSSTPTPLNHTSNGSSNITSDELYDPLPVDDDALPTQQPPVAATGQQKSSVLIRLSNRIKELEMNMSLFGDYLEQFRTRCVCMYVRMWGMCFTILWLIVLSLLIITLCCQQY